MRVRWELCANASIYIWQARAHINFDGFVFFLISLALLVFNYRQFNDVRKTVLSAAPIDFLCNAKNNMKRIDASE